MEIQETTVLEELTGKYTNLTPLQGFAWTPPALIPGPPPSDSGKSGEMLEKEHISHGNGD